MTTKGEAPIILWLRQDLRLADNPALNHAHASGRPIVPVYILDQGHAVRPIGAASLWWLDKSLRALSAGIAGRGGRLILRRGDSEAELRRLIEETGATCVLMNRLFEPDAWSRDADIAHSLHSEGVEVKGFNGALLARPGSVLNGTGRPYKVFTPFMRALRAQAEPPPRTTGPRQLGGAPKLASDDIDDWGLHPTKPDWSKGFLGEPGEAGATAVLSKFVSGALKSYAVDRDRPDRDGTSRLSPHLHYGEISPWQVWRSVYDAAHAGQVAFAQAEKLTSELIWRDFSAHLLHHFPSLPDTAFRPEYDAMEWRTDRAGFNAWTRGQTGYPIVDAGMRELWVTGIMHNRVRMIVASFLIKHLLIDWRKGEAWFWDTLVDADLGQNSQNWQWVAGSGADASPWFRIFNPVTQGEKFDPDGEYVKRWVPELAKIAPSFIHAPWTAPTEVLRDAGVTLGKTYPKPLVDHAEARARALAALKAIKPSSEAYPED
ncbi:deoxyribodipyrimidine photo-lyase [Brevundimonas sp. NIBR11]|uniref:cryptochrome/photolyase family protein n=1 Tax=Brevundimonas sp. NIBR11 TaxID=3015999 RepID=UPI0022F060DA|nr:deoxyribodipyrimidine photo-lyase [Brevundimonas sp. NIBR11]WGM31092.1 Deoxyribodipyrimidine photo-lyase [Brevundimonas sp. NIBR11]